MKDSRIPTDLVAAEIVHSAISTVLTVRQAPLVLGLAGAQGCGKSTIAREVKRQFEAENVATAVLSLDDLYVNRNVRARLAKQVHPLLITRGPPGTHDVGLGRNVLTALKAGKSVRLPRFNKGRDNQTPAAEWPAIETPVRVVIFEGWCIGARAQNEDALKESINQLERTEDRDCVWRRYVNDMLAGDYQLLFSLIDRLIFLRAPNFNIVRDWRTQQEHELAASASREEIPAVMTDAEIERFIQHFERITRHMLDETPGYADLTIELDEHRQPSALIENKSS